MRRPGLRFRGLSARWFSERTRRGLIDPALADLQMEYAAARRSGSRTYATWMLVAGYTGLARALLLTGLGDVASAAQTWRPEEADGLRRGARTALALVIGGTALLMAPTLTQLVWPNTHFDWAARGLLATYLIPQALPVAVPYSLAVAAAWMLFGAARTRKVAAAVLVVATLASAGSIVNLVWVVPEANQAFREHVYAALAPQATAQPRRGLNELGWTEVQRQRREVHSRAGAARVRSFDAWYYRRFAVGLAPLALVACVMAIAFRRMWTRTALTSMTLAVCALHFALLMWARPLASLGVLPPIVLGWSADAICAAAALLLTFGPRSVGASPSPPAPTR